jgi:hypothetical protein
MAASKKFCIVNRNVDESEYRDKHSCRARDHRHMSWKQLKEARLEGYVEPADGDPKPPKRFDSNGRELKPNYLLEWLIPGSVLRYRRDVPLRGLSSKVGEYHANAVVDRKPWASVMLRDVQMRREMEGSVPNQGDR